MATISTWAITAQDNTADHGRFVATALLSEGVIDLSRNPGSGLSKIGSFAVNQDTGSNMNIKVGSGLLGDLVAIQGDAVAGQGLYVAEHQDATATIAIAASDPSQDRIDRVVVPVYDNEADSSGMNKVDIEVLQGTPAGSPSAPALPDGAISLATIEVGASVTAITDSDITDTRQSAVLRPEVVAAEGFVGEAVASGATFVLEVALDRVYRSLRVEIEAAHTNTGWDVGRFFLNADTGANYHGYTSRERRSGTHPGDPLATAVTNSIPIFLRDDGVLAATLFISNPAGGSNPTLHGSGFVSWGTTDTTGFRVECQGQRKNTAAVTSVRLTAPSGFNLASGSKISVYGVPA